MSNEPRHTETGEQLPVGEISNQHLARQISELRKVGDATLAIVSQLPLAISGLSDRASKSEVRLDDHDKQLAALESRVADLETRDGERDRQLAQAIAALRSVSADE